MLQHRRFLTNTGLVLAVALMTLVPAVATADDDNDNPKVRVREWLVLGPIASPLPAFDGEGDSKTKPADILSYEHLAVRDITPVAGSKVRLITDGEVAWSQTRAGEDGLELAVQETVPQVVYLAAYVDVPRWMKIDVEARATQPFELTIDGSEVIKQEKGAKMEDEQSGTAKLVQ